MAQPVAPASPGTSEPKAAPSADRVPAAPLGAAGPGAAPSSASVNADSSERRLLTLGVCCMASKASSQPMQAILRRLERCGDFEIVVFSEDTILNRPVTEWPTMKCLVAFASSGFPLEKCIEYCKLVRPVCINNIDAQASFRSRVAVYKTLTEWCIPCPDHIIVDHAAVRPNGPNELIENENYIKYNGKKISKPFVEKPEDGDRHDIWIYYPRSIGGGAKKLFRKVKDKSSEFDPSQNNIRKDGIYIYEPFLPTQGTDIKVYTVGAGYVHAEARKAPTVDGKVQRSKDGKEVRYPVVLTQGEKAISAFIVKAFRQNICGFDILRTDGGSYVCDVNGWSFVKGNQKYYNDCSTLIRKHLLDECGVTGANTSTMMILGPGDEEIQDAGTELSGYDYSMRESLVNRSPERLRSVIVVMRHGDRRPKEKMKFKSKHPTILAYFDNVEEAEAEVKLKTPEEMGVLKGHMEVWARELRGQLTGKEAQDLDVEKKASLQQDLLSAELLIPVLEMKDRFLGLERKVQLKAVKWKTPREGQPKKVEQVLIVAKWGGELTVSGLAQAKELGRRLRQDLYPNDPTGLLRLHSSFRHDFKIYSSQEGRCQITAAAFTKGFLDLEGDIIPILVSLVTRDNFAQGLLDEPIPKKQRDAVKQKIESLLLSYEDMSSPEMLPQSCPTEHTGLREAASRIRTPLGLLHTIRRLAKQYIDSISAQKEKTYEEVSRHHTESDTECKLHTEHDDEHEDAHEDAVPLGNQVPLGPGPIIPFDLKDNIKRKWLHLRRKEHRWRKLFHGFVKLKNEDLGYDDDNVSYDTSKIPDVWDNLYYDMLTHRQYLGSESCRIAEKMVGIIHPLNEWVCLSEYGISQDEKLRIGVEVTWRLLGKMLGDLEFMIEDDSGKLDEAGRRCASEKHVCVRASSGDVEGEEGASICEGETVDKPPSASSVNNEDQEAISPPATGSATPASKRRGSGLGQGLGCGPASGSGMGPLNPWREWATNSEASDNASRPVSRPASPRTDGQGMLAAAQSSPEEVVQSPRSHDDRKGTRATKHAKLTPQVRNELKQALSDSSDWHPRLNDQVAQLTDIKNTRIVRSRIYVTSASTMHALMNVLRHGHCAGGEEKIISDLGTLTDMNYLTHLVFRCYERDDKEDTVPGDASEKSRYRVEISMSPGVQVFKDGQHEPWPQGSELNQESSLVAPVQIIADAVELSRFERFLTEAIKEYGAGSSSGNED